MTSQIRHSLRYSGEHHDKKKDSILVTFYKNGDIYFKGYSLTITPRRFRSFDVLLSELSRVTNLPQGVRYLLDRENGSKIEALEQLQDGKAYVCASNSKLKRLNYGMKDAHLPQWGSRNKIELPALVNPPQVNTNATPRVVKRRIETREHKPDAPRFDGKINFKARNVTVIRNGNKPRLTCRVLLNKRTAITVNQFLDSVNDSLGVTGSSNVRKLYTSKGKQIYEISDLFNDEEGIFIAVGNERFRVDDIEGIINAEREQFAPPKKNSKSHNTVYSNEGMNKQYLQNNHTRVKENTARSHANKDNHSLPKIRNATNKNYSGNNVFVTNNKSQLNESNRQSLSSPTTIRKPANHKQNDENSNSVKLPVINGGEKDLINANENHEQKTRKTSKSKKESIVQASNNKHGGIEEELKIEEKQETTQKRVSNDFTEEPKEIEYGRITDKKVADVYIMGKKIGDGNFAVVRQCTSKSTKKEFAIKIIDKRKIAGKEKMIDDEITIMRKCRHPNIVRLYEDYDTPTEMFLVMEFVKGGDLFDAISESVKFSENLAKDYFRDICKALHYLHKQKIVHRDLKPENLLVHRRPNGQNKLKLADFGLAVEVKLPLFTVCGTPTYVAPEILEEEGYGLKIDMWAAGVITYIMLCGFPPFRSAKRDQDELFDLIQAGEFEFLSPYWDKISKDAKDLISNLLVVDPQKRYSAEKALRHKWVKLKSPTTGDLSKALLSDEESPAKRRFKAAALAVQGAKKFENLADEFRQHRGEQFISI